MRATALAAAGFRVCAACVLGHAPAPAIAQPCLRRRGVSTHRRARRAARPPHVSATSNVRPTATATKAARVATRAAVALGSSRTAVRFRAIPAPMRTRAPTHKPALASRGPGRTPLDPSSALVGFRRSIGLARHPRIARWRPTKRIAAGPSRMWRPPRRKRNGSPMPRRFACNNTHPAAAPPTPPYWTMERPYPTSRMQLPSACKASVGAD